MTEQKQAMEKALEALENSEPLHEGVGWRKKHFAAKDALRAALSSLPDVQTDELHQQIMNLPVGNPGWAGNDLLLYKEGHKAARHAAAELVSAASAPKEPGRTDGVALGDGGKRWPILYAILRPAIASGNEAVRHHAERLAEVLEGDQRAALRELLDRPAATKEPARVVHGTAGVAVGAGAHPKNEQDQGLRADSVATGPTPSAGVALGEQSSTKGGNK
jgi:hypothetical protein